MEKFPSSNEQPEEKIEKSEAIEHILSLKIGAMKKAELLLVALGHIPASRLELYPSTATPEEALRGLRQAGLYAVPVTPFSSAATGAFAVSRDAVTAQQLSQFSPSHDHEEYGHLLGYPQTAIDAFIGKTERLSEEDRPNDPENLFDIALSKEHWPAELAYLKNLSRTVERYAPEVYEELVRPRREAEYGGIENSDT
jgi:hypothetical protein